MKIHNKDAVLWRYFNEGMLHILHLRKKGSHLSLNRNVMQYSQILSNLIQLFFQHQVFSVLAVCGYSTTAGWTTACLDLAASRSSSVYYSSNKYGSVW